MAFSEAPQTFGGVELIGGCWGVACQQQTLCLAGLPSIHKGLDLFRNRHWLMGVYKV